MSQSPALLDTNILSELLKHHSQVVHRVSVIIFDEGQEASPEWQQEPAGERLDRLT